MLNQEIETIRFIDDDTSQEVIVIVRVVAKKIGLCISLEHEGDIEAQIPITECDSVIKALQAAVEWASQSADASPVDKNHLVV